MTYRWFSLQRMAADYEQLHQGRQPAPDRVDGLLPCEVGPAAWAFAGSRGHRQGPIPLAYGVPPAPNGRRDARPPLWDPAAGSNLADYLAGALTRFQEAS
jgi:hypothetical protein